MPSILIIDDEALITSALRHHFTSLTWDVAEAHTGEQGIAFAEKNPPDIILLDLHLPDMDGLEVLKRIKARHCPASVIIMTAWGSIGNAVEAIKLGAEQYLVKPADLLELSTLADRILETRKLRIENLYYQQRMDHTVLGTSTEIYRLRHMIDLMAENADTTVLLLGESGTGKELVAREIHRQSARRERPFLDINCAALSESLLESEIFGHERGAFTDAREQKPGLLEVADNGTVFLDEIGEMPLAVQPKLLRVLETRSFRRLGGTRDIRVNVRVIAATNRDLERAVREGRFRGDLFYRLKVFPVDIPPLRERMSDVPILVEHFVNYYNAVLKKNITGFTPDALTHLTAYPWPGNVRELKNIIERAMVLTKSDAMDAGLLPREITGVQPPREREDGPLRGADHAPVKHLGDVEKDYILDVLKSKGGNRSVTARLLGIARSTLLEKLKKYGIEENTE
jgi:two-component system, NtrC family, response regulator AtoC